MPGAILAASSIPAAPKRAPPPAQNVGKRRKRIKAPQRLERKVLYNNVFSGPLVLLEKGRGEGGVELFRVPRSILQSKIAAEIPQLLRAAEEALAAGYHVAGYFAYELGYLFEPRFAYFQWPQSAVPLMWLGVFDHPEIRDAADCERLLPASGRAHIGRLDLEWSEADYESKFSRLHEWIRAGDLYQANLTFRARFSFAGDTRALYHDLKRHACAAHCAYIDDGDRQILSLSPELFFELSADGIIRTKPMKGTAARGVTAATDSLNRAHLLASEKERAENLMIVDLMRNDLSRIAEIGSVTVEKLFEVETYPTVHQLVSTVAARVNVPMRIANVVRALFPCGSVTGAPKIRAMEVIRALEDSPRGIYCGAIGTFAPDGSARFNVAIRTLTIRQEQGELGIGGGIVFDSRSAFEYGECLLKARYYQNTRVPISLIETLRWSPDNGFVRLERHLARITASSRTFGISFDRTMALEYLRAAVDGAKTQMHVRLTLSEEGQVVAAAEPLMLRDARSWTFTVSPIRVRSDDVLLRHKTSRRELFDSERERVGGECGADEVLFVNERNEVTEGSRTNVFVALAGMLLTPALSCGLLDGCLRSEMIEQHRCDEAVLGPNDLLRADAVFVGNSLRGLIPALPAPACTAAV